MISVAQGGEVTLNVKFYESAGGPPYDPGTLTLEILNDDNDVVAGPWSYVGAISRPSAGNYYYIWNVPSLFPLGIYTARWTAEIHGNEVHGYEEIEVAEEGSLSPGSTVSFNDPNIEVSEDYIRVKFQQSIKVNSLTNGRFRLFLNPIDAGEVSDPFREIVLTDDYDSIGRYLKLYFKQPLIPNTSYILSVSGLMNAANQELAPINYIFSTLLAVGYQVTVPPPEPIIIEDHSVARDIFTVEDILEAATPSTFFLIGTTLEDFIVEPDHDDGRITLKFNARPAGMFVTSQYFKVQRKQIVRGTSRWLNVPVLLSLDTAATPLPWVYIDFPSTDATPVYHTAGKTYFELGWKYRIKVSKDITT